jgi:hypothetical protein
LLSRKTIHNQPLTSSVLNPRSPEVWRQTAREREFRVTAGLSKCGGFRAKPVVIGLLCGLARQRRKLGVDVLAEGEGFELPVRNAGPTVLHNAGPTVLHRNMRRDLAIHPPLEQSQVSDVLVAKLFRANQPRLAMVCNDQISKGDTVASGKQGVAAGLVNEHVDELLPFDVLFALRSARRSSAVFGNSTTLLPPSLVLDMCVPYVCWFGHRFRRWPGCFHEARAHPCVAPARDRFRKWSRPNFGWHGPVGPRGRCGCYGSAGAGRLLARPWRPYQGDHRNSRTATITALAGATAQTQRAKTAGQHVQMDSPRAAGAHHDRSSKPNDRPLHRYRSLQRRHLRKKRGAQAPATPRWSGRVASSCE